MFSSYSTPFSLSVKWMHTFDIISQMCIILTNITLLKESNTCKDKKRL